MILDRIHHILEKQLFILSNESYYNKDNKRYIERISAKHPLLTPELIVVNNQPYGFRKLNRSTKTLEKFPIYCEMEIYKDIDDEKYIENIELFSEFSTNHQNNISKLTTLYEHFSEFIIIERIKKLGSKEKASLVIYSRINDLFQDNDFNYDDDAQGNNELNQIINNYIKHFVNCIIAIDNIINKNQHVTSNKHLLP